MKPHNPRPAAAHNLTPPYMPQADLDYEEGFRALVAIEAEMMVQGVSAERLLRRGHARFALGNFLAAAFDAERAIRMDPHNPEGDYLKGQAFLAMAAVKHGVARPAIGTGLPKKALPPRRHLLLTARNCFQRVLALNPDDPQARKALRATRAILADLAAHPDAQSPPQAE
ncbi:MAG: hypothetical protein QOD77_947 [Thermoplasmata archaeon]|jgi:tetratricopeptide (TPR) repeat protein|nr:hypothetical protein [Thermoplasmata archaeon]